MITQYVPLTITQDYKPNVHNGIDLRNYEKFLVFVPETVIVLRNSFENGLDKYGNNYVVCKTIDTQTYLYFVHTLPFMKTMNKMTIEKGLAIGTTVIDGNSKGAHLHFAVSKQDRSEFFDPKEYLKSLNISFVYKEGLV